MRAEGSAHTLRLGLRAIPLLFLATVLIGFGLLAPPFLTLGNLTAILDQSSELIVVALGMNFVLLTAGVDLSVGAAMYLAAIVVGLGFTGAPPWVCLTLAVLAGAVFGAVNGLLIVRYRLPAFIATLAMTFIGRGLGLSLSSTQIVFAGTAVANWGRSAMFGVPVSLSVAFGAVLVSWVLMKVTAFGPYVRAIGADPEGARRAGVPVLPVTWSVYGLCGAFAGLGGFIALGRTSSASAAFGQNVEFLAIAASVLGGTSLFGGRGTLWAPIIGALLITSVQNGLAIIDANPYAYPVITGTVIFLAALLDSLRSGALARLGRLRYRWV